MLKFCLFFAILMIAGLALTTVAQDTNQRTRDLVASLDKTKYKKKEKASVSVEVYVDVKNAPAVRANPVEYSGLYDAEGYRLQLEVAADGSAKGYGLDTILENGQQGNFTLKNAHINGALLTATKVYDGGREESFEAVFVDRTSKAGRNPNDVATTETKFGLGFVQTSPANAVEKNRVFLEKR